MWQKKVEIREFIPADRDFHWSLARCKNLWYFFVALLVRAGFFYDLVSLLFSLFCGIRESERCSKMRQVMLKDAGCDILRLSETHSWASPFLLAVKVTRSQMPVLFYHSVIRVLGFFIC